MRASDWTRFGGHNVSFDQALGNVGPRGSVSSAERGHLVLARRSLRLQRNSGEIVLAVSNTETPIDCREAEFLIHLRVDGEVLREDSVELDLHLQQCGSCRDALALAEKTKAHLRAAETSIPIPAGLERRIREQIEEVGQESAIAIQARPQRRFAPLLAASLAGGVFVLLAVIAVVGLGDFGFAGDRTAAPLAGAVDTMSETVVTHALDVPVDVASPDAKVVEEFMRRSIGSAVHVPALDRHGFGLRGGRIVAIQHQRAAQLVYDGGLGKRMTVVVVPDQAGTIARSYAPSTRRSAVSTGVTELQRATRRGFDVRVLQKGGMLYAVVSGDAKGAQALSSELTHSDDVDVVTSALAD